MKKHIVCIILIFVLCFIVILLKELSYKKLSKQVLTPAPRDIFEAASKGDLKTVEKLFYKDPNLINATDDNRGRGRVECLHCAVRSGSLELVKFLIDRGANVNVNEKDDYGETILDYAAHTGSLELVKFLTDKGAFEAASKGDLKTVEKLFYKDLNLINATDDNRGRVLHCAVRSGSLELVKFLIDRGAKINVNEKDDYGETILDYAAHTGSLKLVKFLSDEGAFEATRKGDIQTVKELLNKDPTLIYTKKDGSRYTILHCAVSSGSLELVKFLIDRGANVNVRSDCGYTVLHYAADTGSLKLVKFLIDKGAIVSNVKTDWGDTVLHEAAESGSLELVKFLTDKGLDINNKNVFRETPLHRAVGSQNRSSEVAKFLIDMGTDVNVKDSDGETALGIAVEYTSSKIYKKRISMEVIKLLVDKGSNVNNKSWKYGNTVLHNAVGLGGSIEVIRYLIDKGARINVKNNKGYTVLDCAIQSGFMYIGKG